MENIIKEREQTQETAKENFQSFIDILLSKMHQPIGLNNDGKEVVVNRTMVKAIIIDMFAAALEASAVVVEWALAELMKNPRVMKKLQDEIEGVVGMSRMVEEIDLDKLIYLDLVVKETLRLHPAGSLIPREAREDVIIDGFYIEKKTMVLVNTWGLGRDPKLWSDNAESFYPERFEDNEVDVRGQHFQLIPFGSGRRQCPGMRMGLTIIRLVVAQLVHCFDWELPYGIKPEELDMNEKFGLTIPRAKHLLAIPTCRLYA